MQDTKTILARRTLLKAAGGLALATALPRTLLAAEAAQERHFDPRPGDWKSYEVVTKVNLQRAAGPSTVWIPLPSIDTDWQRTLSNNWSGNAAKAHASSSPNSTAARRRCWKSSRASRPATARRTGRPARRAAKRPRTCACGSSRPT